MLNELNKPEFFFKIFNNILWLQGTLPEGSPLWEIQSRENKAKDNVLKSLASLDQQSHLFIGIEHLAFLLEYQNTFQNMVYIVEKSQPLYEFYVLKHPLNIPQHIKIISGGLGFYPHYLEERYATISNNNDIIKLTLQLFQSEISDWTQIKIYSLDPCLDDQSFYPLFFQSILLILAAKLFHQSNQSRYENIRQSKKNKTVLNPYNGLPSIIQYQDNFFPRHIFRGYQREKIKLNCHESNPGRNPIFSNIKTKPDPDYINTFKFFSDNALILLDAIENTLPSYICTMNRMVFNTLEDILFTEQLVRATDIPYISYYTDPIIITGANTSGSWTQQFIDNYFSHSNYFTLQTSLQLETTFGNKKNPCKIYPFFFNNKETDILPPIKSADLAQHDIVIIQHAFQHFNKFHMVSDLYHLIINYYTGPHLAKALNNLTSQLRFKIKKNYPYFDLNFEFILRDLYFAFYENFKIRALTNTLTSLNEYNIKFFGKNWEHIVPSQYYGGYLKSPDEVNQVFNKSKLTMVSSLTFNDELPHRTTVYAYFSGCLPISTKTVFSETRGSATPMINYNDLVRFDNGDVLKEHIHYYLNNWEARQENILRVQNTWLKKLVNFNNYPTITDILEKENPHFDYSHIDYAITDSAEMDEDICSIALSYLHHYIGFYDVALKTLHSVLMKQNIKSNEVLLFTKNLATLLEEKEMINDLNKLAVS